MPKNKQVLAGIVLALLFLISLIVSALLPAASEVATQELVGQGWKQEDLVFSGFKRTTGWLGFGEQYSARFVVRNTEPLKEINIELHRPLYCFPWSVRK